MTNPEIKRNIKNDIAKQNHWKNKNNIMKKKILLRIALIVLAFTTYAQPGTIDLYFNPGLGVDGIVLTNSIQTDGKIIIGGFFSSYNGTVVNNIARLNTDGTLDTTFQSGTGINNYVYSTSIQSDGKIIIGGDFWFYDGNPVNRIIRLNMDGTLDNTFNPGTGANWYVYSISVQSDGKIIIGGSFWDYNGTATKNIARLNTDGSLDATFINNPGLGPTEYVQTTFVQSDGKIFIGGLFSSYSGTAINSIARLNTDGTLDTNFNIGTGPNGFVYSSSIQSDGKIIIGGDFTSYNGTVINRISRVNTDGTLDATFNPGSGANGWVLSVSIQGDGKIIIGGDFTSYNGYTRNRIARLNIDGTLDTSFNPGTGANDTVWTTSIQSDEKIIVGGNFQVCDGIGRNKVARLKGGTTLGLSIGSNGKSVVIYPNPFSTQTTLQSDHFFMDATMMIFNTRGQLVQKIENISGPTITLFRNNLPNGQYFIKISEEKKIIMADKIIITD